MSLPELELHKSNIKKQFDEISQGLFNGNIELRYVESNRVHAEAVAMYTLQVIRYGEGTFEYTFTFLKYLLSTIDLTTLTVMEAHCPKLNGEKDILSLEALSSIEHYREKTLENNGLFSQLNFVFNLYVYLHECGHLNQELEEGVAGKDANHFAEYNADYYALSKTIQYYYTISKLMPDEYQRLLRFFTNEHNLIRLVVVTSILIPFLETIPKYHAADSETHPAMRKRFCYLIYQSVEQIHENYGHLFANVTPGEFATQIFHTMEFIEENAIESQEKVFRNLINYCLANFEEIKLQLTNSSLFKVFNQ